MRQLISCSLLGILSFIEHNMNQNIKELIEAFDLIVPTEYNLVVSDYAFVDGNIVIKEIKVLDKKWEFIRFAKLDVVVSNMHKYNVLFDKID